MNPSRGEIWLVDLDPTVGHEQAASRPALVVSVDSFNHGKSDLVIMLPATTRERRIRSHIRVNPTPSGFRETSFIMCEMVRSVSRERCIRLLGTVDSRVMDEVGRVLSTLLALC